MRHIIIPPRYIEVDDIVFCKINNEIKECRVLNTLQRIIVATLDDIKEVEDEPYFSSESPKKYSFKKWKYGIEWALTREELEHE